MNWQLRREVIPLVLLLSISILAWILYPSLPEQIPSHFNSRGLPDDYASKQGFILFYLAMNIGLYLLMTFLPWIDPFRKKIENRYETLLLFRNLTLEFLAFVFVLILYTALTGNFSPGFINSAVGVLFMLLGNYLPKLPRNFFFGIRSPWTLASEEVWKRTHRLSGWLFLIAGVLLILFAWIGLKPQIGVYGLVLPLIVFCAVLYPLFLYQKLERQSGNQPQL